jgi:hypothetical protein
LIRLCGSHERAPIDSVSPRRCAPLRRLATAPFIGAVIAIGALHEPMTGGFWLAAALMAAGVWLHLTERHDHVHTHAPMVHTHAHAHDSHHQHAHDFPWNGVEPHSHEHRHVAITHRHPHYPDLHHRDHH